MNLIQEIVDNHEQLTKWRRDLHRHPELSRVENRTSSMIAELLRAFELDPVVEGIGQTGVVGVLTNGDGPVIGLRADMDGLP
ncbi:amidohydrolase, partial [Thermodesulfobacteriota bacterium]